MSDTQADQQDETVAAPPAPARPAHAPIREKTTAFKNFITSRAARWSAAGVATVGAVAFFGNLATILGLFSPQTATTSQVESLQTELALQRQMIAQLLEQTRPADAGAVSPERQAERANAAARVVAAEPEAAAAIAGGDFRAGFLALKARADDLSMEAALAWRDLGALAYDRDPAIALDSYRQAARIDASDFETWMALADLEFDHTRDVSAAKAAAAKALEVAGDIDERLRALEELAALEFEAGELSTARKRYEQLTLILRPMIDKAPTDARLLAILADARDGVGDIAHQAGDFDGAEAAFRDVLEIRRRLQGLDPADIARRQDVSSALESIGELALSADDLKKAEAAFAESLAIDRQIAAADRESLSARRNLAVSLEMYGDILLDLDETQSALEHYQESLQTSRLLLASHPTNALYREDVAFALAQTGTAYLALDDREAGVASYKEMLAIMRGLAEEQKDELRAQLILAETLARTALVADEAPLAAEARKILATARAEGRLDPEHVVAITDTEEALDEFEARQLTDGRR